jgi:hypothetical protein
VPLPDRACIARVDVEVPLGQQHHVCPEFRAVRQAHLPDTTVRRSDVLRPGAVSGDSDAGVCRRVGECCDSAVEGVTQVARGVPAGNEAPSTRPLREPGTTHRRRDTGIAVGVDGDLVGGVVHPHLGRLVGAPDAAGTGRVRVDDVDVGRRNGRESRAVARRMPVVRGPAPTITSVRLMH